MHHLLLDINCDMGEGFGNFPMENEAAIFPYITSCSIACGFHSGDPLHIDQTIDSALHYGLRIGAHPSYPDLQGFGRRAMRIPSEELHAMIRYQVAVLKGMVESKGGKLAYVKPHGALYHAISTNSEEAQCVVSAIASIDPQLALMAFPNSAASEAAARKGMAFLPEAFADRQYGSDGLLLPRNHPQAIHYQVDTVQKQALQIATKRSVKSIEGSVIPLHAATLCLHSDTPQAPVFAKALYEVLLVK